MTQFVSCPAMAAGVIRDEATLQSGIAAWLARVHPEREGQRVDHLVRPAAGWSTETVIVGIAWNGGHQRLVFRLPTVTPSFPSPAFHEQAAVLEALTHSPVPVPQLVAVEDDPAWLGAPFLVMTFVDGRPVGDTPALDPWLIEAPVEQQRDVHEAFLAVLATLHRVDWHAHALDETLRSGVATELEYWLEYVDWAASGEPAPKLVEALQWCAHTAPEQPAASLLWGDARLGNAMYERHGRIVALVDWELATIGPAEMDLSWYLVLDDVLQSFLRKPVPGFLPRADAIAFYEQQLGREVRDLEWHEIFALARSIAINDCQARLARAAGTKYPGIPGPDNPMLHLLTERIAAF
jgi:aminoglycoside phosphotransferase (APT) family kinase protein